MSKASTSFIVELMKLVRATKRRVVQVDFEPAPDGTINLTVTWGDHAPREKP